MATGELSNAGADVALNTLFRTDTVYLGLATCSVDGYLVQNNTPNERESVGILLEEVIENGLAFIDI